MLERLVSMLQRLDGHVSAPAATAERVAPAPVPTPSATPEPASPAGVTIGGQFFPFLPGRTDAVRGPIDISHAIIRHLELDGLTVEGDVSFWRCVFPDSASFRRARIVGSLSLNDCRVRGELNLDHAVIEGSLSLDRSTLRRAMRASALGVDNELRVNGTCFQGEVYLGKAVIGGDATLIPLLGHPTIFEASLSCLGTAFAGDLTADETEFRGGVDFGQATFERNAGLTNCKFHMSADFARAQFGQRTYFTGSVFGLPGSRSSSSAPRDSTVISSPDRVGETTFREATFKDNAAFARTDFRSVANFSGASFNGMAWFGSPDPTEITRFDAEAIFWEATFSRSAIFWRAQFGGEVNFGHVQASESMNFEEAQFGAGVRFHQTEAGPVFFHRSDFHLWADFSLTHFTDIAEFLGVQFGGDVYLRDATFEKNVTFGRHSGDARRGLESRPSRFGGGAWFNRVHFRGSALFDLAEFDTHIVVPFIDLRSSGDSQFAIPVVFHGSRFDGDASFQSVLFAQGISCDGARFASRAFFRPLPGARNDRVRCRGPASFRGCRFIGESFFHDMRFTQWCDFRGSAFGSWATFAGAHFGGFARFLTTRFDQGLEFDRAKFQRFATFADMVVKGEARFVGTRFRNLVLREASFQGLVFRAQMVRHAVPVNDRRYRGWRQFGGWLDIRGCAYSRIYVAIPEMQRAIVRWERKREWAIRRDLQRPTVATPDVALGGQIDLHERQPFTQLEATLRAMGRHDEADDVYVGLRDYELRRKLTWARRRQWVSAAGDLAYRAVARYGVSAVQLVWPIVLFLLLGIFVFAQQGAVIKRQPAPANAPPNVAETVDAWRAASLSVNLLIPVETPWGGDLKPSDELIPWIGGTLPYSAYGTVHRLAGWILIPLSVAVIAGLLNRRQRR